MADGMVPNEEYAAQIRKVVFQILQELGLLDTKRPTLHREHQQELYGILRGDLAAATDFLTTPATVSVEVLRRNPTTEELEATGQLETLTHRFEGITVAENTGCRFKHIAGDLQLTAVDCQAMGNPPT